METGITQAAQQPLLSKAPRTVLSGNSIPRTTSISSVSSDIVTLNAFEVRCILLQIAYMETESNVAAVSGDRLGQYLISDFVLKHYGYKNNSGWTNLDGIDTQELFLENAAVQNKILQLFFDDNYEKLIQSGAIRANDSKAVVAGMLALSYQFQDAENPNTVQTGKINNALYDLILDQANYNYNAIKCQIWRDQGSQQDSLGRAGSLFFNAGKYAVQNLAADYS